MFSCNHEEADNRIVLHALLSNQDAVIVAKDTDVLILLVWAYNNFNVQYKWFLKYEHEAYADISQIWLFLGKEICTSLISFHAITGCDATSYMFRVGKLKCFKKVMNQRENCRLLENLELEEPLTEHDIVDLKKFVQTVMYSGQTSETYVNTRIRLYQQQTQNTSLNLPPDPSSLLQALKRSQLQVYIWKRRGEINIEDVDPLCYGWQFDKIKNMLMPIWFTGKQLPPSLCKPDRTIRKKVCDESGNSDLELSDVNKRKTGKKRHNSETATGGIDADAELSEKEVVIRKRSKVGRALPKETRLEISQNTDVAVDNNLADYSDSRECTNDTDESDWEVSDFFSSNDSNFDDEWAP